MTKGLENYCALDLSEDSEAVAGLMKQIDAEANGGLTIDLTSARQRYDAQTPAALTPAMAAWYSGRIAGRRGKAVAEINSAFQNEDMPEGSPKSTFIEVRRDEVRAQSLTEKIAQTAQFLDHNKALIERHNACLLDFNTMKAQNGREPVKPRPILYAAAMIGLVTLEAFINFESFLKVPYITSPFLATGATLAVALAIAGAAHFHGVVLRQWHYLFSQQAPSDKSHPARKADAKRRLAIGAILLLIALAMVAGSRYYYLREYIMQARILGSAPPSMLGGIVFMLFGNVVAYLVAVVVSYGLHDSDPRYAEKHRELKQTAGRLEAIKTRRKTSQEAEQQGLNNAITAETNQSNNARGPNHAALRSLVDQLIEKDQEVLAVLQNYRIGLVQALRTASETRFRLPEGAFEEVLPTAIDRYLAPRQYATEQIHLGFSSGEKT